MMETLAKQPVGQIVAEDYRTAHVLRAHGLDFCCGGKKTLESACEANNIELDNVLDELSIIKQSGTDSNNYNDWPLDLLAEYIENAHHTYVRKMLLELNFYAEKVARRHGAHHPELIEILQQVRQLNEEMLEHMQKEEEGIFPQVKELVRNNKRGSVGELIVEALEEEHERAGDIMAEIYRLSSGFNPPEDACASYRVLFQSLEGFQNDLHKHVHLENNILFPKALQYEKSLAG